MWSRFIAVAIEEMRVRQGMTQRVFAEKIGTSESGWYRKSVGKRSMSFAELERSADVLGVPAEGIITRAKELAREREVV